MGVPAVREARRGHGLPIHGHSRARPRSIHRVLHNGPRDAGDVAYADPRNRRRDRGPQVASRLATARAELVSAPRTISRLPAGRRARPPRVRRSPCGPFSAGTPRGPPGRHEGVRGTDRPARLRGAPPCGVDGAPVPRGGLHRPPDPRTDRPRSNVAFVPTKSIDTSAPSSPAIWRTAFLARSGGTAWSAPESRAALRASSRTSTARTRAPWTFAICMAESPTPPAPMTTARSPSPAWPSATTDRYAVAPLHPRGAARAGSRFGGNGGTVVCFPPTNSA